MSKHQIHPDRVENDNADDAGRDGLTHLARKKGQARTAADRGRLIFSVKLTTIRIGNLTRLILTLLAKK